MDFDSFLGSVQGRKIQKQIRAAHEHIMQHLDYTGRLIEKSRGDYLAVDEKGKIVLRHCNPGLNPGEANDHGGH